MSRSPSLALAACRALLVLGLGLGAVAGRAQEPASTEPATGSVPGTVDSGTVSQAPAATEKDRGVPRETGDAADEPAAAAGQDEPWEGPCDVPPEGDWLDRVRWGIFRSICGSARWFDGFFGDRRFDAEARGTHGRLQLRLVYDEFYGLEPQSRLRVDVDLPNVDDRINAFVGRESDDDFVTDRTQGSSILPDFFREAEDQEWLVGLGYSPASGVRRRFDLDGGVEVDFPLKPFVRGRFRQFWLLGDDTVLRFRETGYWKNQRGFGTTTALDLERALGERTLARLSGSGTIDQETPGVYWSTGVTLYHGLGETRAVALRIGAEGSTDAEVPLREYGGSLTYRRQMFRDWLFAEVIGGVTWPREELDEVRDAAWHLGFGIEIQFAGRDLGVPPPSRMPPPPD